jgi:hypothetical protein
MQAVSKTSLYIPSSSAERIRFSGGTVVSAINFFSLCMVWGKIAKIHHTLLLQGVHLLYQLIVNTIDTRLGTLGLSQTRQGLDEAMF